MTTVPAIRIRNCNQSPARPSADYVLYWMIATRRLHSNFALDRALQHCAAFAKPLLIFEPLRVGYPWASDRFHRFVLDGMAANALACQSGRVRYYPYVEPSPGADKGLLAALAQNACVVVTDDFPCFFLPRMVAATAKNLSVLLEAVDSNGLLPLRAAEQTFLRAFDFRRFLQKKLPQHLAHFPHPNPLAKAKLPPLLPFLEKLPAAGPPPAKLSSPASLAHLTVFPSTIPSSPRRFVVAIRTPAPTCCSSLVQSFLDMPNSATIPTTTSPAAFLPSSISAIFPPTKFSLNWLGAKNGSPRNSLCAPTAAAKAGGT